ncbi:MAG: hypothetical protein IJE68_02870 [Clostridia bacterium]|nr:hypothetical protein [Clostridia bacterium]
MCDKIAKVAAEWWIEQMKKRCTILYPTRIIKDRNGFVITDDFFAEELTRFEKDLVNEIQKSLQKFHYLCLWCCYTPDPILLGVAKQSKVPITYFPIHADMEIHHTSICVCTGENDMHELRIPT